MMFIKKMIFLAASAFLLLISTIAAFGKPMVNGTVSEIVNSTIPVVFQDAIRRQESEAPYLHGWSVC